jgi:hypothetical protein
MDKLLAEWLIGEPEDGYTSSAMEDGSALEPVAVSLYEMMHDVSTEVVGIVTTDDCLIGFSPDRLVGEDGGLEIKCVKSNTQVNTYLANKMPGKHIPQVQGNIWGCEREWWDFMSYNEKLEPFIVRIERDDDYIAGLKKHVLDFSDRLEENKIKLEQRKVWS